MISDTMYRYPAHILHSFHTTLQEALELTRSSGTLFLPFRLSSVAQHTARQPALLHIPATALEMASILTTHILLKYGFESNL
jgi:hypothetical protein